MAIKCSVDSMNLDSTADDSTRATKTVIDYLYIIFQKSVCLRARRMWLVVIVRARSSVPVGLRYTAATDTDVPRARGHAPDVHNLAGVQFWRAYLLNPVNCTISIPVDSYYAFKAYSVLSVDFSEVCCLTRPIICLCFSSWHASGRYWPFVYALTTTTTTTQH